MTGAKKITLMKNQFLHGRQPVEEIFEFCSCSGFIFMTDFWNFMRLFQIVWRRSLFGSYLENKCFPSLCLPAIQCTKLGMKYGFPLIAMSRN